MLTWYRTRLFKLLFSEYRLSLKTDFLRTIRNFATFEINEFECFKTLHSKNKIHKNYILQKKNQRNLICNNEKVYKIY